MNAQITIFVHIPKTAGTTFNRLLQDQYTRDQIAYLHDDPSWSTERLVKICNHPQSPVRAISGHFPFGLHHLIDKPCTYATFLRDTLKLYMSMFSYIQSSPVIPAHPKVINMNFQQFMECEELNPLTSNIQTKYLTGVPGRFVHQPGSQYFSWNPGDYIPNLEVAKRNLLTYFSYIGITERFHTDLTAMAKQLGWSSPVQKYAENETKRMKPSLDSLNPKTIQRFYEKNVMDLELYRFAYELTNERR
ncbi:sulfotransferase family 2 domain-containing protein [Paenibacillus sp. YYML68]|uniref:sulfotransferase family 2 domain-containing protein n=1 Tax=Paenibacillus sp. YYML68 TaxID=2909250 RepID=UPI00248FB7FC|nr:sulfotransferase family 2 domain-containing protein [Paenibacillus sp. YYML68]